MATTQNNFVVEGVDDDDGSRTELNSFETSSEARQWLTLYTRRPENDGRCGGWSLIEVYDLRGEDAERVYFWEREVK